MKYQLCIYAYLIAYKIEGVYSLISKVDSSTWKSTISPCDVPVAIRLSGPIPILWEFDAFLKGLIAVNEFVYDDPPSVFLFRVYVDFIPIWNW